MSSETLQFDIVDSVGKITFNRPDVFNSFNREMALACIEALKECDTNPAIRAVYLTGSGKAFCAGQDLQEAIDPAGPEIVHIVEEHYNPIITLIRQIEKPVIAAVNGVAAGAGANMALACDVVIATKSAKFIQAFSAIGLIPDSGGTFFLPRLIGWQKASAIAMLGDKIGAEEAEKMGMIYKWTEDEEFAEVSWKIATRLSNMPTKGLGLTKRLFNESLSNNLEQQLNREGQEQEIAAKTYDYNEGVNAFLEKRKPEFKGK